MKLLDDKKFLAEIEQGIQNSLEDEVRVGWENEVWVSTKEIKRILSKHTKELPKKKFKFKTQHAVIPMDGLIAMDNYREGYDACLKDCEEK